jgi:hypothetical protein
VSHVSNTIIHENGIEIDPKGVQKFLGKVNYLGRFICNLLGKVNAFTPLLQLKNELDFT